jgi:prepilin-type N-terminal cleavage/methylation domain-containing protein
VLVGRRRGFTLIELLVVIAIIALLVAMLLPAVQMVREAARKAQCQDHLHNIAIALHDYEITHRAFPIGARGQPLNGGSLGHSWWIGLLPFIEQKPLWDAFDHVSARNGWTLLNVSNRNLGKGVVIDLMRCPSSPLPETRGLPTNDHMQPSYVGISGATDDHGVRATRLSLCCSPTNSGKISADGVLFPNGSVRVAAVTDGLSNVMLVGEAADWSIDASGDRQRIDGAFPESWISGTAAQGVPPDFRGVAPSVPPAYNITTIRHPINARYDPKQGIHQSHGANNPLASAHPGGAHVVLGDAAVRFLSENFHSPILQKAAVRDDGEHAAIR